MAGPPASTLEPVTADRPRSVLREVSFLRLWAGSTASGLATWAMPFILGLAVLHSAITPTALGLVLAVRTVGFLIAVPVGGVLADRWSRRSVVLWSSLAAAVATPVLAMSLGRSVALMAVAGAVIGAGQGACRPAFQALTAEVVRPGRRQQANAAMTLAVRVTTLAGPALAALLATVLDVPTLLLGSGVLWLAAALLPPRGKPAPAPAPDGAERTGFAAEFADGVREARRHPWFLGGLVALAAVIATGYSATGVVLPMVSRDRYGTEAVLATAVTAYTAGALLGALLIARWRPRSRGWAALAALACYGFAPLSLWLPGPVALVVVAYAVAGVGIELFNVPWFTAIQREVEPRRLARVSSLDFMVSYGLAPVGLALIAPAVDAFGPGPVLGLCTLVCFLVPAGAALVPTARHFSRGGARSTPEAVA
ncbi:MULTISPECIES: MFS transporter [unclassified Streptomyces]|uniref:MFS transporter n=1 Tax=unclassified Streptomyces TaxID=2593676 RepID=UPI0019043D90|nr:MULTISPECIES: MFS transporter [unclassified Streptomyces]MCU4748953.1 MFS transporter [Streptomyces sp. G-5]